MLVPPQKLAGERCDERRFPRPRRPHHGDAATRAAVMFEGRRPDEPQVTMGFHGRERVGAVDQLLRR